MSMLAYYHKVNPLDLQLLPVLPTYDNYNRNKYMCNLTSFTPIGHEIPRPTGDGIWDSNSWGQYLGYSLTHSLTYSLTHLLTYSLTHLLTHLLTYNL